MLYYIRSLDVEFLGVYYHSPLKKFDYHCVGCLLQNNSPRAQDRCRDEKDEYEDRDWLWSNPKPKPDDVGLMNQIEAVGINADETDDFGETGSARDQSRDTDDRKQAARARSERESAI